MATQGYIKLHRQFMEWQHFSDTTTAMLFISLLLMASSKDRRSWGEPIKRGQVFTTCERLAETLNVTYKTVQRSLKKLKESGEIQGERRPRGILITIVNYNKYQDSEAPPKPQISHFEQ